jgi:hypothetical protein
MNSRRGDGSLQVRFAIFNPTWTGFNPRQTDSKPERTDAKPERTDAKPERIGMTPCMKIANFKQKKAKTAGFGVFRRK